MSKTDNYEANMKEICVDMVDEVISFNQEILGIEQRSLSLLPDNELNITKECLLEEAHELVDAHCDKDLIGCADALLDSIYFAIGGLYKLGLNAEQIRQCMSAVHNCNMYKSIGKNAKRDTGAADAVKPNDWVGPEEAIAKIIGGSWV